MGGHALAVALEAGHLSAFENVRSWDFQGWRAGIRAPHFQDSRRRGQVLLHEQRKSDEQSFIFNIHCQYWGSLSLLSIPPARGGFFCGLSRWSA